MKRFLKEVWQTKSGKLCVGFLIPALILFYTLITRSAYMELLAIPVAVADSVLLLSAIFCFLLAIPIWARFWTYLLLLIGLPCLLWATTLFCYIGGFSNEKNALNSAANILCYIALPLWGTWLLTSVTKYVLNHSKLKSSLAICCAIFLPIYINIGGWGIVLLWIIAYELTQTSRWKKILQIEALLSIAYMIYLSWIGFDCTCSYSSTLWRSRCNLGCRSKDVWFWEILIWLGLLGSIYLYKFLKRHNTTHYLWILYLIVSWIIFYLI